MVLLSDTKSICPKCLKKVDAKIILEDNRIYIEKSCIADGTFKNILFHDKSVYSKLNRFKSNNNRTILGLVDVTNRCSLACPICFANAAATGTLYEPAFNQIRQMLGNLRNTAYPAPAVMYCGGEPTVRADIVKLVGLAKDEGFIHILMATNGIALANDKELAFKLKSAGLNAAYLQFDGVSKDAYIKSRNVDLFNKKTDAIQNCREAGLSVVLVPTLVRGINDNQINDIIGFAADNMDIVRGVNFQTVSFAGRTPSYVVEKERIGLDDFINMVDKDSTFLKKSDFYPLAAIEPLSKLLNPGMVLSANSNCSVGTYVLKDKNNPVPLTDVINIENMLNLINNAFEPAEIIEGIADLINSSNISDDNHILNTLKGIFIEKDYSSLEKFHENALLVSCESFMDCYNFDYSRIHNCPIKYAAPDNKIISFCLMNNIYRTQMEDKYNIPSKSERAREIMKSYAKLRKERNNPFKLI